MTGERPAVVVIDGHDGAGKTTVARRVAELTQGQYVKPFCDSLGDHIAWLWRNRRFDLADRVARSAVERMLGQAQPGRTLVFDRHWLTMFTVLPEEFFAGWEPRPRTVLCWTDVPTTVARLRTRGEAERTVESHAHYVRLYRALAERFGVPVVDTTSTPQEECARLALAGVGLA